MFEYLAGWGVLIFCLMAGGALLNWSNKTSEYQRGFNDAMEMKTKQAAINFEMMQKEKSNDKSNS